jgi:hypothetical protein
MSVYVGIDVHRKRSQVAVIDQGGEVLANRNVPTPTSRPAVGGRGAGSMGTCWRNNSWLPLCRRLLGWAPRSPGPRRRSSR